MPKLKELEKFFCEAMAHGWAAGNNGETKGLMLSQVVPGWHEVQYFPEMNGFSLTDRWGTDPGSGKPSGQTIIYHRTIPIWAMWYGGDSYPKQALPLLKSALLENYSKGIFTGGRGPGFFGDSLYSYINEAEGDFARFSGRERIGDEDMQVQIGSHFYWGGSLVYLQ
jgi:hypothetical protein